MYSGAVVKVCTDSQQNNKKRPFCTLKRAILLNFVKNKYFRHKGGFSVILSVFRQKQNPLEPKYN